MIHPWRVRRSRVETANHFFTLKTLTSVSPRSGREHDFYVLEAGDWCERHSADPDGQVLMVRQFRHGTGEVTLEVPGGLIDPGQTPAQAAARELLEETGHSRAGWWKWAGSAPTRPS
jgi:8-oxo-dGTP pyrophosphatase MutT (NUDIX family)